MESVNKSKGTIITFYSYKGGTGRSMALSNTACLLAEKLSSDSKGILMMDWDLEAPGLHKYFQKYLGKNSNKGLIELFWQYQQLLSDKTKNQNIAALDTESRSINLLPLSESLAKNVIDEVNFDHYVTKTDIRGLYLLKAGGFDNNGNEQYSELVNTFDWEAFYNQSPHLIRVFAEFLAERYEYILIDSRTGVTDVSGICTTLLPEKLVVVFTPNRQSLEGAMDLMKAATDYRKESADLRPLMIYPLVSRIPAEEPQLRNNWRLGNEKQQIEGFQPKLETLLAEIYDRQAIDFTSYFDEVQIQHVPRYGYGEEIAVLIEKTTDRFSLRRSYETFVERLIRKNVPWDERKKSIVQKRCLVIIPFGKKIDSDSGRQYDFDKIYNLAIQPAAESNSFFCYREYDIIKTEMLGSAILEELLKAELVIADLTINNFYVAYQLGIRHACRPFSTIIISGGKAGADFSMFRTILWHYPDNSLDVESSGFTELKSLLVRALSNLKDENQVDSPVYLQLPKLTPPSLNENPIIEIQQNIEKQKQQLADIKTKLETEKNPPKIILDYNEQIAKIKERIDQYEKQLEAIKTNSAG